MIRIFTTTGTNAIIMTVDGQLVAESVQAVATSAQEAIRHDKPVHLFLRNVSHIDEHGRALLSQLAAKGVQLRASGVYSCYVVEEIRREHARNGSDKGPRHSGRIT